MPSDCSPGDSGRYAVRDNPAAYYANVAGACRTLDVPLGFPPDLSARFTLVTPDLCHDMHDCDVRTGDAWLNRSVDQAGDRRATRFTHYSVLRTTEELLGLGFLGSASSARMRSALNL